MSAMAVGMASEVASVVADKLENEMEHSEEPTPCIGTSCCLESACLNLPVLRCSTSRGPTKCVGSSLLHAKRGVCSCLLGPCSQDGRCPVGPGGAAYAPAASPPAFPAPAYGPAAAAFAPVAASGQAPTMPQELPQAPVQEGPALNPSNGPNGDFGMWHTNPSRLYVARAVDLGGPVPKEDLSLGLALLAAAALAPAAGAAALALRLRGRGGLWPGRWRRGRPEEELVDASVE